jgi:hypothetical protein
MPAALRRVKVAGTSAHQEVIMRRRLLAVSAVTALALAGCGGGGAEVDIEDPVVPESPEESPEALVPGTDPTADPGERPEPGQCTDLPYSEAGDYAAADAGVATIILEGDRLVVEDVEPAEGWEHEVPAGEGPRAEVRFTGDSDVLVLYGEVLQGDEAGLAQISLCSESE